MKKIIMVLFGAAFLLMLSSCGESFFSNTQTTQSSTKSDEQHPYNSDSVGSSSQTTNLTEINEDIKNVLWSLSMDAVKAELKNPSSAVFPFSYNSNEVSFSKVDDIYSVKSYVDAKNDLGTVVRTEFTVQATCNNSKAKLASLSFGSENNSLLGFQEDLDSIGDQLRENNDTGNYSINEEAVWQYCMDRWDYYDNLEGKYSGDKYTEQVFNDAASKFGLSASEAKRIWDKVDKEKLGLN